MINCFSVVSELVSEADKKFGSAWKINQKDYKSVETVCGLVDNIIREFNAAGFDVEIDDRRTDIIISVVCEDFEISSKSHDLYTLFHCAYSVDIKADTKNDMVIIVFRFPGVWDLV